MSVAVVGLWSRLSIAAAVKSRFLRIDAHAIPSSKYLPTAASPNCAETSRILS